MLILKNIKNCISLATKSFYFHILIITLVIIPSLLSAKEQDKSDNCKLANNMASHANNINSLNRQLAIYQEAVGLCDNDYNLNYNIALIHFKLNAFLKSEDYIDRAMRIKPTSEARLLKARSLKQRGLNEHAEKEINKARKSNPENCDLLRLDFYQAIKNAQYNDAVKIALKLFNQEHNIITKEDYYNLGFAYDQLREFDNAKQNYLLALEEDTNYLKANLNLALLFIEAKKIEQAKFYLKKVLELDERHVEALRALSNVYMLEGKIDEQISSLNNLLSVNNQDFFARRALGFAYYRQQDLNSAEREFINTLKIRDDYQVLNTLGYFSMQKGDYKKAELYFKNALALSSYGSSEVYNNLGVLKSKQGNQEEAEKLYQRALDRDQDNVLAKENLKH